MPIWALTQSLGVIHKKTSARVWEGGQEETDTCGHGGGG